MKRNEQEQDKIPNLLHLGTSTGDHRSDLTKKDVSAFCVGKLI
jgi:hypothetical protein